MALWFKEVGLAIISGLVTTISAACLLGILNFLRNKWLTKNVIKAIQEKSHQCGTKNGQLKYMDAGVVIYNPFEFPLTIRAVWAETKEKSGTARYPLKYTCPYYQKDIIPIGFFKKQNPYGFISLEPFTNGQWVIGSDEIDHVIDRIFIYVEFLTFFRIPKVIQVNLKKPLILEFINDMVEENISPEDKAKQSS